MCVCVCRIHRQRDVYPILCLIFLFAKILFYWLGRPNSCAVKRKIKNGARVTRLKRTALSSDLMTPTHLQHATHDTGGQLGGYAGEGIYICICMCI